jgi:hypothetical protein
MTTWIYLNAVLAAWIGIHWALVHENTKMAYWLKLVLALVAPFVLWPITLVGLVYHFGPQKKKQSQEPQP